MSYENKDPERFYTYKGSLCDGATAAGQLTYRARDMCFKDGSFSYLVNGTWNQAHDVLSPSKYFWKGSAEGWCCLHSRETDLADVVTIFKTKDVFDLVGCDTLLDAEDLTIEIFSSSIEQII